MADDKAAAHLTGAAWRSTLWEIVGRIKWFGLGVLLIYVVILSIFLGYITQDVQPSAVLGDWYPILLIAAYNVFDLLGKCLPAVHMLQDENVAVAGCVARLLFFPLFLVCLHGPGFFRREMPVTVLTCPAGPVERVPHRRSDDPRPQGRPITARRDRWDCHRPVSDLWAGHWLRRVLVLDHLKIIRRRRHTTHRETGAGSFASTLLERADGSCVEGVCIFFFSFCAEIYRSVVGEAHKAYDPQRTSEEGTPEVSMSD